MMRVTKLASLPTARQISQQKNREQNPNAPRAIMPDGQRDAAVSAYPTALQ